MKPVVITKKYEGRDPKIPLYGCDKKLNEAIIIRGLKEVHNF